MLLIKTFICSCQIAKVTYNMLSPLTQSSCGRITQRSTGRQKQPRFLAVGNFLVKEHYHFIRKSFFAFAACELIVICLKKTYDSIYRTDDIYFLGIARHNDEIKKCNFIVAWTKVQYNKPILKKCIKLKMEAT